MKIHNVSQRSPEWFEIRAGKPTASNFEKLITSTGQPSKQAVKYMYKLAGEYVSKTCEESYINFAMQTGIEREAEARTLYEMIRGVEVEEVGFITDDKEKFGCSPDALIGDDGLLEIKCPTIAVHVDYLIRGALPTSYFQQVQGQLFVTGRKYCDFVSFYPGLRPLIVTVHPDGDFHDALENALGTFCGELQNVINKIK